MDKNAAVKRVRRSYSKQFKSEVIAQCLAGGKSVAGIALEHGLNANVVHKWRRRAQAAQLAAPMPPFVAIATPAPAVADIVPRQAIDIEVVRGDTTVPMQWPLDAATACAFWLRDWLR
ncbi:IS66-like element accessory protein TnpA [Pandoraea sputorum]|uniref:IS66-like element accessory protein TnpA n=1 Tax=Pandoraea sputorum TaxID=93222 RepID=UPI001254EB82|nr:transposase [Pandoraea sputorum]VVE59149.1 IS66 family insertion sequence hypothetical protein [Pandoraea sputorum]